MASTLTVEAGKAVWDGRHLVDWLPDVVAELVRTFDPAEVWLFGSVAEDTTMATAISISSSFSTSTTPPTPSS